jgi:hypothetical protein
MVQLRGTLSRATAGRRRLTRRSHCTAVSPLEQPPRTCTARLPSARWQMKERRPDGILSSFRIHRFIKRYRRSLRPTKRILLINWIFLNLYPCPKGRFVFLFAVTQTQLFPCLRYTVHFACVFFTQYWFFFVRIVIEVNVRWMKEVGLKLMTSEMWPQSKQKKKKKVWRLNWAGDRTCQLAVATPFGAVVSTDHQ